MARTATQIITLALQIAKAPGFVTQAQSYLNVILSDLAQDHDFDVIRKTFTFNFDTSAVATLPNGAQAFPLPANYLRARIQEVFYIIQGVKYVMINVELFELDAMVQTAGLNSYPTYFATDVSPMSDGNPAVLYVWPPPAGAYPVTMRYQPQPDDISDFDTVPWFPNQDYLIHKLAASVMNLTNDDRQPAFMKQADDMLLAYLKMKDDKEGRAQTVKLDRRLFSNRFSMLPSTKVVGW